MSQSTRHWAECRVGQFAHRPFTPRSSHRKLWKSSTVCLLLTRHCRISPYSRSFRRVSGSRLHAMAAAMSAAGAGVAAELPERGFLRPCSCLTRGDVTGNVGAPKNFDKADAAGSISALISASVPPPAALPVVVPGFDVSAVNDGDDGRALSPKSPLQAST